MSLPSSPKARASDNGGGNGGGGIFIRLTDGQRVRGVFRGEPRFFYEHFNDRTNRSVECDDEATCALCKQGDKARFKFAMNFITTDASGVRVAKIFKQSNTVYDQLLALSRSGYDVSRTTLEIARTGKSKDTRYNFVPVPNGILNDAAAATIDKIPLLKLEPKPNQEGAPSSQGGTDDIPF